MFIIVYSSFIILNYGFLYSLNLCIEFMYLLFLNMYLLASERSERDTLRSVQLRIADIYIYILWYVQILFL